MSIRRGIYRHYKGGRYEVLGEVRHSETEEVLVLYRPLYGSKPGENDLWVRPEVMFTEEVVVDGQPQPRFAWQEPESGGDADKGL